MTISKTYCDVCKAEVSKEGFGQVTGRVTKINEQLEPVPMMFGGDYCESHFLQIATFIGTLKEEGEK